ncbi:MAG: flavodoxin domain-containing protein, partial [Bacteroidales bacterium]|nr:flavodoxin domain-containing protein [Bacteroidales bacterium]
MQKIAIVYSFNTQKTGKIAKRIKEAFGKDATVELVNIEEVTADEFLKYDNLICGTAT